MDPKQALKFVIFLGLFLLSALIFLDPQVRGEHIPVSEEDMKASNIHKLTDGALAEEPLIVDCRLSNRARTKCYEITINTVPTTIETGPFCPETIETSAEDTGIWIDGERLYQADGNFIQSLSERYNDPNWQLYEENSSGSVRITKTKEAFDAATKPEVDPEYNNYCIEGRAEWVDANTRTYKIPIKPVYTGELDRSERRGKAGITYDGVIIDPPIPVDSLFDAYTIAPLDDCGGQYNSHDGYHIHAATGCFELEDIEVEGETNVFGIAMDGFNIHSPYPEEEEPVDLDECNGHFSDELGYHYHAHSPESNKVLGCFMGAIAR